MNTKNESIGNLEDHIVPELKDNHTRWKPVVSMALTLWFGFILLLGAQGAFVGTAGSPPLAIFLGFAVPLPRSAFFLIA